MSEPTTNTNEEDYIDMELTTSSSSPSKNTEFEFQLVPSFSCSHQKQADELFYKGKLLPLVPFREITKLPFQEPLNYHSMPLTAGSSESCRVSCDRDYYPAFPEFSGELTRLPEKKSPAKKLKLGEKLIRASSAYLKSLFTRSSKKGSFGRIEDNGHNNIQRRSFSDTIRRHYPAKCMSSSSSSESSSSSSSFSLRSNGQCEPGFARRDSSASEIEASIDAAIDHCKKSMQIFQAIKSVEDDKRVAGSL